MIHSGRNAAKYNLKIFEKTLKIAIWHVAIFVKFYEMKTIFTDVTLHFAYINDKQLKIFHEGWKYGQFSDFYC